MTECGGYDGSRQQGVKGNRQIMGDALRREHKAVLAAAVLPVVCLLSLSVLPSVITSTALAAEQPSASSVPVGASQSMGSLRGNVATGAVAVDTATDTGHDVVAVAAASTSAPADVPVAGVAQDPSAMKMANDDDDTSAKGFGPAVIFACIALSAAAAIYFLWRDKK